MAKIDQHISKDDKELVSSVSQVDTTTHDLTFNPVKIKYKYK